MTNAEVVSDASGSVYPASSQSLPILVLVLYAGTIAAQLVSLAFGRSNPELSFASIVVPSVLALSVVTLPLCLIGIGLGRELGLGAPLIADLLARRPGSLARLGRDTVLAGTSGLALGVLLLGVRYFSKPYLPPEIPAYGHRGAVGGLAVSFGAAVGEEVWFRLGLMTLLIWVAARILRHREVRPTVAWPVILISAVGFGLVHLPQLISYGAGSPFAMAGTVLGNIVVGMLYGWCYWRRSLVAAMIAHFSVDLVLHVLPALM